MKKPRTGLTVRVGVILIRSARILLVRHEKGGKSYWVLPGGRIERGESPEACAARELLEETGLAVAVGRLVYTHELVGTHSQTLDMIFLGKIVGGRERLGRDPEDKGKGTVLQEMKWHPLEKIGSVYLLPEVIKSAILKDWRGGFRRRKIWLGSFRKEERQEHESQAHEEE